MNTTCEIYEPTDPYDYFFENTPATADVAELVVYKMVEITPVPYSGTEKSFEVKIPKVTGFMIDKPA